MAAAPVDPLLGIAPGVSSRSAQVQAYYQEFLNSDGSAVASGYLSYAGSHTNLDAATAAQAYADSLAVQGLNTAVGAAGTGSGTALGQAITGGVTGAEKAASNPVARAAGSLLGAVDAVPKFLSRLTSGNLWLRIGEVVAGLILLGIGVNSLFKGKPLAAVTTVAGKAAPLAMMA